MGFHPSQAEAIAHGEGPMMVLAGPGSGKTTVITHRTRHLIAERGVSPSRILVITFTRAAAREMETRFLRLPGMEETGGRVSFGTFHSVFFTILKHAYRYQASNVVREEQRIRFMRELLTRHRLEAEDENECISSLLGEISHVKSELLDLEHYYSQNCPDQVFRQIYREYEAWMQAGRMLDFDDMLVMCRQLLLERPDILQAWQNKFQYILVDEFQDINRVQYEIVRMLARPENNLFIVGDDDQSVYRFRGARPEIMLGFPKDYPDAKTVILDTNFRSTREIVEASLRLIGCNQKRYKKDLRAFRGPGKPVLTCASPAPGEETRRIAEEIRGYLQAGYRPEDIAILYRTHLNPRLMVERLMEYNIPFVMKDMLPNLYEHWISRNVLAYIRAAAGDLSRSNVLLFLNRPNRYISRDALEETRVSWDRVKAFYQDREWMQERIEQLEYDLEMLKDMPPAAAVNYIRKAVGYDCYIREYAESRHLKPEDLLEILDQLQESAVGFSETEAWFAHMEAYKKQLKEQAARQQERSGGVALMTMHSSKGLEFPIVYILDANEGITPHRKAVLEADLEEERRMFYVAMTRARDRLCVCYVQERYGRKQQRSRFIGEYLGQPDAGSGARQTEERSRKIWNKG